mgnify:CR=1 FL=1
MISAKDRDILRELATQYRELCDGDENRQRLAMWRKLNNMEPVRPMIQANMGLLGDEIGPQLPECRVTDGRLRNIERRLQRSLWEATLGDDRVFYPWLGVRAEMFSHPEGPWGVEPIRVRDEISRGWRHMPVLKRMEDLANLKATEHRVLNARPPIVDTLEELFGDILPINVDRSTIYGVWGGTDLSEAVGALFGLEELMMALYTDPDMVHAFMAFTRDAVVANLKQGEAAGDWSTTNSNYYMTPACCEALPDPKPHSHGARLKELAYFTHAQEFEGVSPEMHREFLLEYQLPILELFGRIAYGCCETLDNKLDILSVIPNMTKILSGPLSDPACYPERVGDRCVISWRPVASIIASERFDEQAQRQQLREGLAKLRGCQVEVHMHEPMSVQGDLSRIHTWVRIAREEAETVGG